MNIPPTLHVPTFPELPDTYRLITFTGAGGKTSLIQWLAVSASAKKLRTIVTTTTKILPLPGERIIFEEDGPNFLNRVREGINAMSRVVVASRYDTLTGKLIGLRPQTVSALHNAGIADVILVEADGAARKPLKAPNATEPLIPQETDLCIAVMGLDAAYEHLGEATVHRHDIFARITGRSPGDAILPKDMFCIATAPNGLFKGCPPDAHLAVFLNKIDSPGFDSLAERFAALLGVERHPAARWFAGSARKHEVFELTPRKHTGLYNVRPRLEFSHEF